MDRISIPQFHELLQHGNTNMALDILKQMSPNVKQIGCICALVLLSESNPLVDEYNATEELVDLVLRQNCSRMYNNRDMSLLECSVRYSSCSFTELLLKKICWHDRDVTKAFLVSSYLRSAPSCKILFATGKVDIDAPYTDKLNAIQMAIIYDDYDMVEWLLKNGADNTLDSPAGTSNVLLALMRTKDVRLVKLLVAYGSNMHDRSAHMANTAAILAADNGDNGIMEYVLNSGVSVNSQNNYGSTPIQAALTTLAYNPRNVHLLLDAGADVNMTNRQGFNAMEELFRTDTNVKKVLDDPFLWNRLLRDCKADIFRIVHFHVLTRRGNTTPNKLSRLLRSIPESQELFPWIGRMSKGLKFEWTAWTRNKLQEVEAVKIFHLRNLPSDVSRHIKSFLLERGALKKFLKDIKL